MIEKILAIIAIILTIINTTFILKNFESRPYRILSIIGLILVLSFGVLTFLK